LSLQHVVPARGRDDAGICSSIQFFKELKKYSFAIRRREAPSRAVDEFNPNRGGANGGATVFRLAPPSTTLN
jgi:hypothetical protein